LCDESLACDRADFPAGAVLPYRGHVDAAALLSAADRVAGETKQDLGDVSSTW
jgi:hypothetical protein